MYDINAYLELVREYYTMGKLFCVNGVGLLLYRTSSEIGLVYKTIFLYSWEVDQVHLDL